MAAKHKPQCVWLWLFQTQYICRSDLLLMKPGSVPVASNTSWALPQCRFQEDKTLQIVCVKSLGMMDLITLDPEPCDVISGTRVRNAFTLTSGLTLDLPHVTTLSPETLFCFYWRCAFLYILYIFVILVCVMLVFHTMGLRETECPVLTVELTINLN